MCNANNVLEKLICVGNYIDALTKNCYLLYEALSAAQLNINWNKLKARRNIEGGRNVCVFLLLLLLLLLLALHTWFSAGVNLQKQ